MYQEVFEIEFLRDTEAMYRAEALKMMRDPEFTVRGGEGREALLAFSSVIPQYRLTILVMTLIDVIQV